MNKNSKVFGVIALVCIAVVVGIVFYGRMGGSRTNDRVLDPEEERLVTELLDADSYEKVDIGTMATAYDEITAVYKGLDKNEKVVGYAAFLTVEGYGGPMHVHVSTDEHGQRVQRVRIGKNEETEGVGKKVMEEDFTRRFEGASLPVGLQEGMGLPDEGTQDVGKLRDGTYEAAAEERDHSGYLSKVMMQISDGKIVSIDWDEENEEGESKKNASIKGEYIMTEDGLRWHEQAELMENLLLEMQEPSKIVMREDGKTDAVSGVSISISNFVRLSEKCLMQARGMEFDGEKRTVEAISGATVSSTAVVNAVNIAGEFIGENLNQ